MSESNEFLKIKKHHKYEYYYAERKGVDSIAFVLRDGIKVGLINEFKPPIDRHLITAFGGSLDKNKPIIQIVIEETLEEAGYTVGADRILYLGSRFVSTQMNQFCHLFIVDVTGLEPGEREPENYIEAMAEVVWCSPSEVLNPSFSDWKAQAILASRLF